mmetsp:Transcript_12809/g.46050  ORF Transcript_12809/g.46050 Transcript_12809/m.46050 type:complete len:238 (+) Transcript_12809:433-1146(+)
MYTVRSVGCSCLLSIALCTSVNSVLIFFSSAPDVGRSRSFFACCARSRDSSFSHVCLHWRYGTMYAAGSANRSLTLSSPVQLSRCVFLSTYTDPVGAGPYQRSRMAIARGAFFSLAWYSSKCTLSRYTELVIWLSACEGNVSPAKPGATPSPLSPAAASTSPFTRSRSTRNTGKCCAMFCFTPLTSSGDTQYFRVVRTKSCAPSRSLAFFFFPFAFRVRSPRRSSNRSDICTTKTLE